MPGLGYWLLGQRTRGLTIGVTVILLFLAGILIGGVRVLEVPGYNRDGGKIIVSRGADARWVMTVAPLSEIANKPWSITQVLTGPLGLFGFFASAWASRPSGPAMSAPGVGVHSHVNEIAVLYTAVAGMLNLLAILDASARAGQASK